MEKKLFTHFNVDMDAAASVWAVKQFISPEWDVQFVPANWEGELGEGGLAVDISAGGRGLKGSQDPDGTVHSCFATLVSEYASREDQAALADLVEFVDAQDAHGSAVGYLAPQATKHAKGVLGATGLNAVLRALQAVNPRDDATVVEKFGEILSGMLRAGRARQRAVTEADKAEILPGGRVAICDNNREYATNGVLFDRGVVAIVYIDGNNLGVIRSGSETTRMDNDAIKAVVEEAGEIAEWFAHPAGFLFCRGSRKAPAEGPSGVDSETLAKALDASLNN